MDYRIFSVRTYAIILMRIHTGVEHTDNESVQHVDSEKLSHILLVLLTSYRHGGLVVKASAS